MQALGNTPGKHAREVTNCQTVAEWMAELVPVVSAPHAQTRWPEMLVLNSLPFWWRGIGENKTKTPLFSIPAASGYDGDGKNGRLWRLEAHPTQTVPVWEEGLARFPDDPVSIVADEDIAIRGAIMAHWGTAFWTDRYHSCEYHLYE